VRWWWEDVACTQRCTEHTTGSTSQELTHGLSKYLGIVLNAFQLRM